MNATAVALRHSRACPLGRVDPPPQVVPSLDQVLPSMPSLDQVASSLEQVTPTCSLDQVAPSVGRLRDELVETFRSRQALLLAAEREVRLPCCQTGVAQCVLC